MTRTGQKYTVRALACAGIVWLAAVATVRAAFVEYTSSVTPTREVTQSSGRSGQPLTLNVQQFNTGTYGLLLSVQFSLKGYFDSGSSYVDYENLTSGYIASVTNISLSATVYADWGAAGDDMSTMPAHSTASLSLGAYDGAADWLGSDTQTVTVDNQATAQLTGTSDDRTLFTGTSVVPVALRTSLLSFSDTLESGKNIQRQLATYLGADLTVRYTYGDIPEPMSLLLLGGGAVLLVLRRPRRTAVSSD